MVSVFLVGKGCTITFNCLYPSFQLNGGGMLSHLQSYHNSIYIHILEFAEVHIKNVSLCFGVYCLNELISTSPNFNIYSVSICGKVLISIQVYNAVISDQRTIKICFAWFLSKITIKFNLNIPGLEVTLSLPILIFFTNDLLQITTFLNSKYNKRQFLFFFFCGRTVSNQKI